MEKPWLQQKEFQKASNTAPNHLEPQGPQGRSPPRHLWAPVITPGRAHPQPPQSPPKDQKPLSVPEQGLSAYWSPKRQRAQGQEEEPKTLIGLPHVDHGWQAKLELNLSHLTPWAGRMGVARDQSFPSDDTSVGARSGALRGVGNPEHNEWQ